MLAGMNERLPDTAALESAQNGRRFHEVRPGSYDVKNVLHFTNHLQSNLSLVRKRVKRSLRKMA
jgi:hypothetical protein